MLNFIIVLNLSEAIGGLYHVFVSFFCEQHMIFMYVILIYISETKLAYEQRVMPTER